MIGFAHTIPSVPQLYFFRKSALDAVLLSVMFLPSSLDFDQVNEHCSGIETDEECRRQRVPLNKAR